MRRALGWMVLAGVIPAGLAAQSGGFVTRLGTDTLAVERYVRSGNRIEGDLLVTTPRTRATHYVITLEPNGLLRHLEMTAKALVDGPGGLPPGKLVIDAAPGGMVEVLTRNGKTDTIRVATPQGLPFIFYSWAAYELATTYAARAQADSVPIAFVASGSPNPIATAVVRRAADSVSVDFFGTLLYFRVDRSGQVLGVNGARTTAKVIGTRVKTVDVAAVGETFAARERRGQVVGQLSPRDTVRATVGGAEIMVDYGRPTKRGRVIWGTVVPYDQVWRTGANEATQLSTSRPLVLENGTVVPAGQYTLWTLPTTRGTQVIFNRQTKQWGTEYHAEQDLTRVEAGVEKLDDVVEQMAIRVVPSGQGGTLRIEWDRTGVVVPFKVQ